ncbi:hypothetical protein EAH87_15650 [Sphingomonas koreensis]|nr:hypothetical protein EAH87_15650 [Sphingomonas koreensis]
MKERGQLTAHKQRGPFFANGGRSDVQEYPVLGMSFAQMRKRRLRFSRSVAGCRRTALIIAAQIVELSGRARTDFSIAAVRICTQLTTDIQD